MCGRFLQLPLQFPEQAPWPELAHELVELTARYNLAPTQRAAVVLDDAGDMKVRRLRWGLLPFWAKDLKSGASMINARIETVGTKPAYRAAFKTRRCVLPMAGYYEWQDTPSGKQPYLITLRDGHDLFAAGLWEPRHALQPENEDGSCTIITTTGVDAAGGIHDRMPVFVPPGLIDRWMHATPEEAMVLLVAIPTPDLALRPVTRRMSSYRFEDASILDPIDPAELLD
jgi:putative SOS response-associated peptidase YedK